MSRNLDRVADAVMRMSQAVSSGTPSIQRACPKCEDDELKRQPIKEEDAEEANRRRGGRKAAKETKRRGGGRASGESNLR